MTMPSRSNRSRRGVAVVEFAFSLLFLVPLLIGVFIFGFKLIRSLGMTQVTRDMGAMYLRGVDFRGSGARDTAATVAQGYNMVAGGTSTLILSKLKLVTAADCTAANAIAPVVSGSNCPNKDKVVFVEQLRVGNATMGVSSFGTPPVLPSSCTPIAAGVPCSYTVTTFDQGRNSAAVANNFAMVLKAGELAYMAEMINLTPDITIPGLSGGPQIYARAIF